MKYKQMVKATFIERPNRFVAYCEVEGERYKVHVKNTGRCKELLQPGVTVYLEKSTNPNRKTPYSLIAVEKGSLLINMDSQAPNVVVEEGLKLGRIQLPHLDDPLTVIKREKNYGHSRFDFYCETQNDKIFIEVKGVTLEEEGIVRFPDAPTERGVKHLEELILAHQEGYRAYVIFVVQMEEATYFSPHEERHPAFAKTLRKAVTCGVEVLAYTCKVTPECLEIMKPLEVRL
ncbi:MAG: DNA/RNA nuclease SfsA [Cellulosilyticum sp.]|nr:DNA/RNA nuclease SfsA [Cellulosilyticum sp.]